MSRRSRSGAGARASGVAALLAVASVLSAVTPASAAPGGPAAEVVPGAGTATPALVDGIAEPARATGSAADAAREHLAAREGRYAIADPGRDLAPAGTVTEGADETVRFQQRYRGVPVLGGQYLVRMERRGGGRVVTGTSGRYFTGLDAPATATVPTATAVARAVAATRAEQSARKLARVPAGTAPLKGVPHGLVVLPRGSGVLTQHVTVTGTDPVTGAPLKEEVYVDARAGFPVLRYSGIQTVDGAPATGSGVKLDGTKVALDVTRGGGGFALRDQRHHGGGGRTISTWDATGVDVQDASGKWPAGISEVASAAKAFGKDATDKGAVDAHWAAGQVYDYYKKNHGRNSLDGRGGTLNSLVGVTEYGLPYANAFWDGQKMVYGSGGDGYKPMSADLDVVGHEMTHGVVEHTAGLVYTGQSGALNEAIADYFGNAIDVDVTRPPAATAALIGEDLCTDRTGADCALRDLNDGRTTAKDFLGVQYGTDNGGVHLNSTIVSGALWDIREDLGGRLADRIVYRALTSYLTPLDGFTQARTAVVAAARELKVSAGQLRAVKRAFDAHGIVPGWEKAIGADSDELLGDVNTKGTPAGAGGGWWAASRSDEEGGEPYSVYAGRTDGKGAPRLLSPNDGRFHVYPDTDGTTAAWAAYGPTGTAVLSRPLKGGPVRTLWSTTAQVGNVHVAGSTVTWQESTPGGNLRVAWLRTGERVPHYADGGRTDVSTALPTVSATRLAYAKAYTDADGIGQITTEIRDLRSGKVTTLAPKGARSGIATPVLTSTYLYWLVDDIEDDWRMGVRRAKLDGTGLTDLVPESTEDAHYQALDATDQALTLTYWKPRSWGPVWVPLENQHLTKVYQADPDARNLQRVSCTRGEQDGAAADTGRRVVWLDGTTGHTDLVTRARPAGRC
ncbi:M4 family metallopeptidase [Streptomyces sp. NPDC001941]|uniref:M4 family metallopeptidase n=1 Tax=Streptomyces sp. NPDC001941 TaxID=3154659 RepID=UPI0033338BAA